VKVDYSGKNELFTAVKPYINLNKLNAALINNTNNANNNVRQYRINKSTCIPCLTNLKWMKSLSYYGLLRCQ